MQAQTKGKVYSWTIVALAVAGWVLATIMLSNI